MKSHVLSIRITSQLNEYLYRTQKMRTNLSIQTGPLKLYESYSDLIKLAIIRLYNDTLEYYLQEQKDLYSDEFVKEVFHDENEDVKIEE